MSNSAEKKPFYMVKNINPIAAFDKKLRVYDKCENGTTFYPTRTCFQDVMEFVVKSYGVDKKWFQAEIIDKKAYTIVHAILEFDGIKYAHAWLEVNNGTLVQANLYGEEKLFIIFPTSEYRERNHIIYEKRYSLDIYFMLCTKFDHTGPWVKKILEACPKTQSENPSDIIRDCNAYMKATEPIQSR